jgi:hypothetical protein
MQPPNDKDLLGKDMHKLFADNFTSSATRSESEWKGSVDEQRERAKSVQGRAETVLEQRAAANQGLGLPVSNAGWMDLITEASLLPKPQLGSIQRGAVPASAPPPGVGQGVARLGDALQNPLVQQWLRNNPNAIGQAAARSNNPAVEALAREPEK